MEQKLLLPHITSPKEGSSRVGSFRSLISSRTQVFSFSLSPSTYWHLSTCLSPHGCKMAVTVPTITSSLSHRERQKDQFFPMYLSLSKENPFLRRLCTSPPEDFFSCLIDQNCVSQVCSQTNY